MWYKSKAFPNLGLHRPLFSVLFYYSMWTFLPSTIQFDTTLFRLTILISRIATALRSDQFRNMAREPQEFFTTTIAIHKIGYGGTGKGGTMGNMR